MSLFFFALSVVMVIKKDIMSNVTLDFILFII